MKKVFGWLQGRSTTFCAAFFVSGNVMHALHRLDATYISFMTALLGVIVVHSYKEDKVNADKPTN